ncbi:MAG: leucine-rich repeat domain-containing protein [Prevotella sp.]|nr:leucine-rich repeat domain-containing protein [Prevotella sp.]
MKQLSKNLALLVLLLLIGQRGFSFDFEVDGIYYGYNPDSQTAYVTRGDQDYSGSIIIPASVTFNGRTLNVVGIADKAFKNNRNLISVTVPEGVTYIGDAAFCGCSSLASISLPNSLSSIGYSWDRCEGAFYGCRSLKSIFIPDAIKSIVEKTFRKCGLESIIIGKGVEEIKDYAFDACTNMKTVIIPSNVAIIGESAFSNCSSLDTLIFEDSDVPLVIKYKERDESGIVAYIYGPANLYFGRDCQMKNVLNYWENLKTLSIGKNVRNQTFPYCNVLENIYSMIETPESLACDFSSKVYANSHLYVPTGTKEKYMAADGWKKFFMIEEMNVSDMWGGNGEPPTDDENKGKCEKPTIRYTNGKLLFDSATEGAICQSTITDSDIKSYSGNEIQLGVTYNISVYATALGYQNSEVATATLCWIDVEPKTEGIESGVAQVRANAVLIQSHDGTVSVEGVADGTDITIYDTSGQMVGSTKAHCNYTTIATNLRNGSVAIVRVGDKSLKIIMK